MSQDNDDLAIETIQKMIEWHSMQSRRYQAMLDTYNRYIEDGYPSQDYNDEKDGSDEDSDQFHERYMHIKTSEQIARSVVFDVLRELQLINTTPCVPMDNLKPCGTVDDQPETVQEVADKLQKYNQESHSESLKEAMGFNLQEQSKDHLGEGYLNPNCEAPSDLEKASDITVPYIPIGQRIDTSDIEMTKGQGAPNFGPGEQYFAPAKPVLDDPSNPPAECAGDLPGICKHGEYEGRCGICKGLARITAEADKAVEDIEDMIHKTILENDPEIPHGSSSMISNWKQDKEFRDIDPTSQTKLDEPFPGAESKLLNESLYLDESLMPDIRQTHDPANVYAHSDESYSEFYIWTPKKRKDWIDKFILNSPIEFPGEHPFKFSKADRNYIDSQRKKKAEIAAKVCDVPSGRLKPGQVILANPEDFKRHENGEITLEELSSRIHKVSPEQAVEYMEAQENKRIADRLAYWTPEKRREWIDDNILGDSDSIQPFPFSDEDKAYIDQQRGAYDLNPEERRLIIENAFLTGDLSILPFEINEEESIYLKGIIDKAEKPASVSVILNDDLQPGPEAIIEHHFKEVEKNIEPLTESFNKLKSFPSGESIKDIPDYSENFKDANDAINSANKTILSQLKKNDEKLNPSEEADNKKTKLEKLQDKAKVRRSGTNPISRVQTEKAIGKNGRVKGNYSNISHDSVIDKYLSEDPIF